MPPAISFDKLFVKCLKLSIAATTVDHIDASQVVEKSIVQSTARLLEVSVERLTNALTTRTIFTRGDQVVTQMGAGQAMDVRDAFVKGIYGRMFIWLVEKINVAIFQAKPSPKHFRSSIGVLDIFGFENFGRNRCVLLF